MRRVAEGTVSVEPLGSLQTATRRHGSPGGSAARRGLDARFLIRAAGGIMVPMTDCPFRAPRDTPRDRPPAFAVADRYPAAPGPTMAHVHVHAIPPRQRY